MLCMFEICDTRIRFTTKVFIEMPRDNDTGICQEKPPVRGDILISAKQLTILLLTIKMDFQ